jgi:uncharacterized protein HemY
MPRKVTLVPALSIALLALISSPAAAESAVAEQVLEERKVEAVGPWAYKRIERMHEDLRAEEFEYVLDTLDEMKRNHTLNAHERALMWQGYGYAYIGTEDYEKAAEALENCIATGGLPFQSELHTRYNLAQILVMLERSGRAIEEFEQWFAHARNPSPTAYYMAAMAYMQAGRRREAIDHVDLAIEKAAEPKESWLQLKNAMLVEEKDYEGAEAVLGELIERFPKKAYWMQLAAIYSETNRHERALTTLEMVYLQGLLDQESEYLTLAQMYLYNQIPYQAAAVLRDGLDKGIVADSSKSWQLLADSWLAARERDEALPPMRKAAELAENGNVYVRLAQILIDREEWGEARGALEKALAKGDLDHPGHAQLFLGIALANEQQWDRAERAFAAAQQDQATEKAAEYWLNQVAAKRSEGGQELATVDRQKPETAEDRA